MKEYTQRGIREIDDALTFNDINIVPKFSDIITRADVDITTRLVGDVYLENPIIPANMDTICGLDMMIAAAEAGSIGFLHRFMTTEETVEIIRTFIDDFTVDGIWHDAPIGVSIGATPDAISRAQAVLDLFCGKVLDTTGRLVFLIDVAHGHHGEVKKTIFDLKKLIVDRGQQHRVFIIAGNIATYDAAISLLAVGADGLKVGIGNGCFPPGTLVNTSSGLVRIEDISIGDEVLTHTNEYHSVLNIINRPCDEAALITINNDISCTPDHKVYAIHKDHTQMVNDDNYMEYGKWIKASDLTTDWFLVDLS